MKQKTVQSKMVRLRDDHEPVLVTKVQAKKLLKKAETFEPHEYIERQDCLALAKKRLGHKLSHID